VFGGAGFASLISGVGGEPVVESVTGRAYVPWALQLRTVAGVDGAVVGSATVPERLIEVGFAVFAGDRSAEVLQDVERALAGWAVVREPRPLVFSDQAPRSYEAVLGAYTVSREQPWWISGSLVFTCPGPWLWDDKITIVGPDSEGVLVADTNIYVEPVWTLSPAASVSSLTLTVNGAGWVYDGPVTPSTPLTVDVAARETHQGGVLRVAEVSGEYPVLGPVNTVAVSSGTVAAAYRARWL
jgi:predicted phage tail component-like protein